MSRVTTTISIAALCAVLALLTKLLWSNKTTAETDVFGSFDHLVFRFREVCDNILDPKNLAFLVENAPAYAIASYGIRQQELARFSLRVASTAVLHNITAAGTLDSASSLPVRAEKPISKVKAAFLLFVCLTSRAGLWVFRYFNKVVPRSIQFWLPARVLTVVGSTVGYLSHNLDEESPLDPVSKLQNLKTSPIEDQCETVVDAVRAALGRALPNDVAQMIYVATLRDNNTGGYFHPNLARRFTLADADRAILVCHQEIYERLVSLELEDLTDQLDAYFESVRAPKARSLDNWKKLQAYRATIPINADPISTEILFMKIDVALAILEARLPAEN